MNPKNEALEIMSVQVQRWIKQQIESGEYDTNHQMYFTQYIKADGIRGSLKMEFKLSTSEEPL